MKAGGCSSRKLFTNSNSFSVNLKKDAECRAYCLPLDVILLMVRFQLKLSHEFNTGPCKTSKSISSFLAGSQKFLGLPLNLLCSVL